MLGVFGDFVPKFVKQYANIGDIMKDSIKNYILEVNTGAFPQENTAFQ